MRHDLSVRGHRFALRPVTLEDAGLILDLRRVGERGRFLHDIPPTVAEQVAYLQRYFGREGDYYFVIESVADGRAEGLIALYDVDWGVRCGEWGRWILREGSLAATESALLIYRVAFELLHLDSVYCRTVVANAKTLSFHESCGLEKTGILRGHAMLADGAADVVEHRLYASRWPEIRDRLDRLASRLSRHAARDIANR